MRVLIKSRFKRNVTAVLLEKQEKFLKEEAAFSSGMNLMETPTNAANAAGASGGFGAGAPDAALLLVSTPF